VADSDLYLALETSLPESTQADKPTALFCFGTCFHRHRTVLSLEVVVSGRAHGVSAFGMPRLDLFTALHPSLGTGEEPIPAFDPESELDPEVRCYRSGFWATVPLVVPTEAREPIVLSVRATLDDGEVVEVEAGRVPVHLRQPKGSPAVTPPPGTIAVCMATYNPDMELFRAQVESLRAQTDENWLCVVSDDCSQLSRFREIEAELAGDDRFTLYRSPRRGGVYRNFERALEFVPSGVELVALCDQDDRWFSDKLATLRAGLGDAQLVYSDQRLVDPAGAVQAETYWTARRNNHTNLASLLIANTITGAASLMRREVVECALPFPEVPGEQFHDHWLGLVALTLGDVAYVDRPLYDYVQHGGATLGHTAANAGILGRLPAGIRGMELRRRFGIRRIRQLLSNSRAAYFHVYMRLVVLAEVLLVRCGSRATGAKRRSLKRLIGAERSPLAAAWLASRLLRPHLGLNETLGMERLLLRGILWRHAIVAETRGHLRPGGSTHDASLPASAGPLSISADADPETAHIQRMIEPLFSVSDAEPPRVNLLIPTIDLRHLFGGYIAKFNLARRLAEAGHRVRIVTVDPTPALPPDWRSQVEAYDGLQGTLSKVEVAFARDANHLLAVSPSDRFIATTWWTAHIAHEASQQSGRGRFLYLIQEYEPFTFVMGSLAALAMQSYEFPHLAVFSTQLLRDYFARHGFGVYAAGREDGDRDSIAFQNAITPVRVPSVEELAARDGHRLLFYARSEPHAKRNMFELGLIAISEAIERGVFGDGWSFYGIGAVDGRSRLPLPRGAQLDVLRRRAQSAYGGMLPEHDVGLSLMFTPHPSLVPIEMASAGMLAVTNSFETKTPERMTAISSNLITASPGIEGIVTGLEEAVARVGDLEARVRGAEVAWSRSWDEAFDEPLMARLEGLLERC